MSWIESHNGYRLDIINPDPSNITLDCLATSLGHICRFVGHCRAHYSVAQHSIYVAMLAPPRLRLDALLHDAHEMITGDIPAPLKAKLNQESDGFLYMIEERAQRAIYEAFGLPEPDADARKRIHHLDLIMLQTERRDLMISGLENEWHPEIEGHAPTELFEVRPWNPHLAIKEFERMLRHYWFDRFGEYPGY